MLSSALTTQGKEGVRRVLEKYLFGGGESEMLVRSVTRGEGTSGEGEGFGLTLVGMGVEWGLEAIIAEGAYPSPRLARSRSLLTLFRTLPDPQV